MIAMYSFNILALLTGAGVVFASPHGMPAVTPAPNVDFSPRAIAAVGWTIEPACSTVSWLSSLVSKMNHPPEPFTPIPFCSTLLQPYAEVISTTTLRGSVTRTSTLPTTTRTTTTDPNSRTTTLLCPSPTPNPWCGITGTFTTDFLTNHIIHHENGVENGKTCKQKCLAEKRCKSFVTYDASWGGSSCDMYDQSLEEGFAGRNTGNDAGPDHWFDRACPDLLPPGCLKPSPSPTKGLQKRIDIPPFLAGEWLLQYACSCFITSALPTSTRTITFPYDLQSYTTTRSTETHTETSTSLLHLTTSYTVVAKA